MSQLKNNADVLSWALSMSSKKKDRSENDENCSPNRYPASRRSEDILNFALTQSSKKQKVNNEDEANDYKKLDNNNDYNNYDSNDYNLNNEDETISKNQEYNNEQNDEINIDDNNANNNNDDTNEYNPNRKELHTMLKSKLISGLEFELIDILNHASLENLLLLKGIGKKYGQNIIGKYSIISFIVTIIYYHYLLLDLREDNFKFSSLSQIEKIGIKKTKIGEFINSNLGIILTRL